MPVVELEYLSGKQVGQRLGISAARVRAYRREGRLPAVHTPLGNLHPLSAVEALAEERKRARAIRTEGRLQIPTNVPVPPVDAVP